MRKGSLVSNRFLVLWMVSFFLLGVVCLPQRFSFAEDPIDPVSVLEDMFREASNIDDYRCTFIKTEEIDGEFQTETIAYSFKKPKMIRMQWIEPKRGLTAVFDGEEMMVNLFMRLVFKLNPQSRWGHWGSNHSIDESDLPSIIRRVRKNYEYPSVEAKFLAQETVGSHRLYKIELISVREVDGLYCHRALLWVVPEMRLPYRLEFYDFGNRLFERFTFEDLRINRGIPDEEFKL